MQLTHRPRRLRKTPWLRALRRETTLLETDFIMPLFLQFGKATKVAIAGMPGIYRYSIDEALAAVEGWKAEGLALEALLLFGVPEHKDAVGSDSLSETGLIHQAVVAFKKSFPELVLMADVCLCEYTTHGHCGVVRGTQLDNDATLELLQKQALNYAAAGVDLVAPSGMMDGMVMALRRALDRAGYSDLPIMSYAVKYASALYGPFRAAVRSAPNFGDRKSYQMDPANGREALLEAKLDEAQGADILMVKPALFYLDVIAKVRQQALVPLAAYQTSGEYGLLKAGAAAGITAYEQARHESLLAIKRAGADFIISYFTIEMLRYFKNRPVL